MIDPRIPLALDDEVDQLHAEINEQARLLGISAEKELALQAANERLKAELAAALAACEKMGDFLQFAWRDVPMSEYAFDRLESVLAIKPDSSALRQHDEAMIVKIKAQGPAAYLDCFGEPYRQRKDAMNTDESVPTPLYCLPEGD